MGRGRVVRAVGVAVVLWFVSLQGTPGGVVLGLAGRAAAQITVTTARIGCLDIQRSPNLTSLVGRACNGRQSCSYKAPTPAAYQRAGVRAATRTFCTQGMEIAYRCQGHAGTDVVTVAGDAWKQPPAKLVCVAPPPGRTAPTGTTVNSSEPSGNAAQVAVLQDILRKYERCIIERYETRKTASLPHRDASTCADGRSCTRATRALAYSKLRELARRGDPTDFEDLLTRAVLGDCMECRKHQKWHTKHTHCTMDCGGNNGLFKGPCFESCKAGVDINAFVRDVKRELAKHAALFAGNFSGNGIEAVAAQEERRRRDIGQTVATNNHLVMPTDAEKCDKEPKGYYVVPEDRDLLDWRPAGAGPSWNEFLTGYSPPGAVTPSTFALPWSATSVVRKGAPPIGANEGRLRADLREVAAAADPVDALCKSAAAFASNRQSDGRALADLSVTGRRTFAKFRAQPPQLDAIVACLKRGAGAQQPESALRAAANQALERAYRVATVLRSGGWPARCGERAALGFIAVSGEDDQPHRPVNVPSADFAQHDLTVRVRGIDVHTRYVIAEPGAASGTCRYQAMKLPSEPAPKLPADAEVILFIHGMDSRLEEALELTHALHELGKARGKTYAVIAVDLPTSGYADNLDFERFSKLNDIGRATIPPGMMGFAPAAGHRVPLLDFNTEFLVQFVRALSNRLSGVAGQIRAVVGGSLGGNLSMRFGRPRPDVPWLPGIVAWSPAGMWASKSDNDVEHVALALPWAFAGGDARFKAERPWSRNAFFYGGFDWQGKAAFVINITSPQAEAWYGPSYACRDSAIRMARLGRYETYDENFRRWHWRLATEQLIYSHQDIEGSQPRYIKNTLPTLLMCGVDDTAGGLCDATRQVAAKMKYTPGHGLWLRKTGHSIHDEHPNFLARHIADFVVRPARGISLEPDVGRSGSVLSTTSSRSPDACRAACMRNGQCRGYQYQRPSNPAAQGVCSLLSQVTGTSIDVDMVSGAK